MKRIRKILVIGGTGRKSGKTTIAVKLIEKYAGTAIIAVKITPHLHPDNGGLLPVFKNDNFSVFEEFNRTSVKDTSRMLAAGAEHVYLITAGEQYLKPAFETLLDYLPEDRPVICESPAFRRFFIPDLFIVMQQAGNSVTKSKDITDILPFADLVVKLDEFSQDIEESIAINAENCWEIRDINGQDS